MGEKRQAVIVKRNFVLLAFMVLCLCQSACSAPSPELEDMVKHLRFEEATKLYEQMSVENQRKLANSYLAAVSYMKRHQYEKAEPLLKRCERANYLYENDDLPHLLLERIAVARKLTPPLYKVFKAGASTLTVYGKHDKWLDEVYVVMPKFVDQAKAAFPDDDTNISLQMFDDKKTYVEAFKANFEGHMPGADQAGTGVTNFAVFSEFCLDGSSRGLNDLTDRRGCVLHEYGHSLCATVYGDDYFYVVPVWLNEGLADLIARPIFGEQFDVRPAEIAAKATTYAPPSYQDFCHKFYGTGAMPYVLGKLMVKEIFGKSNLSDVSRVLAAAKKRHGDFDAAILDVTRVEPSIVYKKLCDKYWSGKK